jgi:hypothetical protein
MGVFEVRGAMADMQGFQTLGQEHLEGPAQQSLTRIAEHLFGLSIHRHDGPAPVHDEDRLGGCFEDGARLSLALMESGRGPLAIRDITGDLRGADDASGRVLDGPDGERDADCSPVLCHAGRLEMVDDLAALDPGKNLRFLASALLGDDAHDGLADHLGRRVAEHPLGGRVPRGDDPVQRLADDCIVR